jgi:hypothetical protein
MFLLLITFDATSTKIAKKQQGIRNKKRRDEWFAEPLNEGTVIPTVLTALWSS